MFTLHGKQIRCGIRPANLPYTPELSPADTYNPFPTLQSISLSLPVGLQQILQIGVMPLRDIISLTVENPIDVSVNCLLDEDYPYYPQLLSFFRKHPATKHFPLVDMRISLGVLFHNNAAPAIELRCGVAKGVRIQADEGAAQLEFQFTFPIGYLVVDAGDYANLPYWITEAPPARKISMICQAVNKYGENILGRAAASVASFNLSAQFSNSFAQTLPNLMHALFGSPIMPTGIHAIINEGGVSYNGSMTLLLPPQIEVPPVTTPAADIYITFTTLRGLTLHLQEAKIQQVTPSLSVGARQQITLSFLGKMIHFTTEGE